MGGVLEPILMRIMMDQPPAGSVELTKNVNPTSETINMYDMVTIFLIGADRRLPRTQKLLPHQKLSACLTFCLFVFVSPP